MKLIMENWRKFLNENLMSPEQRSVNARPVYYMLDKLLSKPEFSQHKQGLEQLMVKASNTVGKKEGALSDEEFTELVSASRDTSSLKAFQDRVMAMLSQGTMQGDIDGDGDMDPQDVADLAQKVAQGTSSSSHTTTMDDFYGVVDKYPKIKDARLQYIIDLVRDGKDLSQLNAIESAFAADLQRIQPQKKDSKPMDDDFKLEAQ